MWVGDCNVDKRQVDIHVEGLTLLNNFARCVTLNVVADGGLGDRQQRKIPDGNAREQKRNERNQENTGRKRLTFHNVSVGPIVRVLNPSDRC
jgi:hypothetical protein